MAAPSDAPAHAYSSRSPAVTGIRAARSAGSNPPTRPSTSAKPRPVASSFGVTVNAVAPGIIDTQAVRDLPHYQKVRENAEKNTPVPRIGQPEDVADVVAFLASARASYVSGDVLHVSGGRY